VGGLYRIEEGEGVFGIIAISFLSPRGTEEGRGRRSAPAIRRRGGSAALALRRGGGGGCGSLGVEGRRRWGPFIAVERRWRGRG